MNLRRLLLCLAMCLPAAANAEEITTLQAALDFGLRHNPDVRAARLAIEEREAIWIELRGHVLPNLGVDIHYARQDRRLLSTFNDETFGTPDLWDARIYARQVLYAGGAAVGTGKREQAAQSAVLAALERTVNRLVYDIQRSYFAAVWAEAEADVQAEAVRLLTEQLTDVERKRQIGTLSDFEVLRAEVELANARVLALRAKNDVRIRAEELRGLLGEGARLGQLTRTAPTEMPVESLAALHERALARRPEIRVAAAAIDTAKAGKSIARAGYLPLVDAEAQYGIEKDNFAPVFWASRRGWRIGIGADWRFFDSFSTVGKTRQADIATTLADVDYNHTLFVVALDVERAYSAYAEARELFQATQQVERAASESQRLAKVRFDAGTATQLDVFAAQVALTQARSNALRAEHDLAVALAGLRRATGDFALTDIDPK